MRITRFQIAVGDGALPLRFGMSPAQVRDVLGDEPIRTSNSDGAGRTEDYEGWVGVHYDRTEKVFEISFVPGAVELYYCGVRLIGSARTPNPLHALVRASPNAVEDVGFVIFPELALAVTGYHDGDRAQRAITVFKPGTWPLDGLDPIDLKQFA